MPAKVSGGSRFHAIRFATRARLDTPAFTFSGCMTDESGASQLLCTWTGPWDALLMTGAQMYPVTSA